MLSNAEITEIIDAVNNEAYTIVDALNELAKAAKGEDVRRALYATAYVLNKEGHSGSVDVQARAGIENLTTSVNEDIAGIDSYTRTNITSMQTQINNIDTTRRALAIDQLWTGSENYKNAVITLSSSMETYQYLAVYFEHYRKLCPVAFIPVSVLIDTNAFTLASIGGHDARMTVSRTSNTQLIISDSVSYDSTGHYGYTTAPTSGSFESQIFVTVTHIYGIKTL